MAAALFLVTKSDANHNQTINGIRAVLINADGADSVTVVKAAAVAACTRSYTGADVDSSFRTDYFDAAVLVSDLVAGPLKDAGDAYAFGEVAPRKIEAV